MSLSIILATRGRPHLLIPTIETTMANVVRDDTTLIIAIDADDALTAKALDDRYLGKQTPCSLQFSVMPREDSLGEKYNNRLSVVPADVYLVMVDYASHITTGFDQRILDTAAIFPDQVGIIYNHMANGSFPGINAVTHRLVELMGGIYPPHFPYWFVDHWLDDIGRLIDRIAFCDVRIDTSRRPGTMEANEPYWWATFFDALWPERVAIASRIIDAPEFQEASWRKILLREAFPLVKARSVNINNHVRNASWARNGSDAEFINPRYARIKKRAIEIARPYVLALKEQAA